VTSFRASVPAFLLAWAAVGCSQGSGNTTNHVLASIPLPSGVHECTPGLAAAHGVLCLRGAAEPRPVAVVLVAWLRAHRATVKTSRCSVTHGMTFCSIAATLQGMPFGAFVGPNDTVTKRGVFVSGGLGGSATVPSIPRGTPTPLG
jgi:hypothetical protein